EEKLQIQVIKKKQQRRKKRKERKGRGREESGYTRRKLRLLTVGASGRRRRHPNDRHDATSTRGCLGHRQTAHQQYSARRRTTGSFVWPGRRYRHRSATSRAHRTAPPLNRLRAELLSRD